MVSDDRIGRRKSQTAALLLSRKIGVENLLQVLL